MDWSVGYSEREKQVLEGQYRGAMRVLDLNLDFFLRGAAHSAAERSVAANNQGPTLKAMYNGVGGDVKSFIIFRYHDTADGTSDPNLSDLYGRMGVVKKDYTHKVAYSFLGCESGGRNCQN
jgi:hypothetical protein